MNNRTDDDSEKLQNTLVAVVGMGDKVWQLADQRVQERGRLLVLLTEQQHVPTYDETNNFTWDPPKRMKPDCEQARQMVRKYKAQISRRWISKGPDIVELKEGETYEMEAHGRGLRVVSEGTVVWQVSAKTLLADEVTDVAAESLSVGTDGVHTVTPVPGTNTYGFMLMYLVFLAIMFSFNDNEKEDGPPYIRGTYFGMIGAAYGTCHGNNFVGSAATGIENNSTKAKVVAYLVTLCTLFALLVMPIGDGSTFSCWIAASLTVVSCHFTLVPLHLYNVAQPTFPLKPGEKAPERMSILGFHFAKPRYFAWAKAQQDASTGAWVIFYAIGVVYVYACSTGYSNVANAALPILVVTMEGLFVSIAQAGYTKHVFNMHASGNQMYLLSISVCTIHAFAEGVKLYATIGGAAVCEDNPNGLKWPAEGSCNPYGWILSTCVGLPVTLASRFGWLRYCVVRCLRAVRLPTLATIVSPSVVTKLHDEAKYVFGYSRFVVAGAVVLANVMAGKGPILFNTPATVCFFTALVFEMIEDVAVSSEVLPYPPSPNPGAYMMRDNFDPCQLYAFAKSPEADLDSRKSSMKISYDFVTSPAPLRTDGDHFPRALPLHGTRDMTPFEVVGHVTSTAMFSLCLGQLLVGAGYFLGVCAFPLSEEDRFKEVALWPNPLNVCRYSN